MSLPEIPDEAVAPVQAVVAGDVVSDLEAAWPFLYAAALRHAIGEINPECDAGHVEDLRWLAYAADQATARPVLGEPEAPA